MIKSFFNSLYNAFSNKGSSSRFDMWSYLIITFLFAFISKFACDYFLQKGEKDLGYIVMISRSILQLIIIFLVVLWLAENEDNRSSAYSLIFVALLVLFISFTAKITWKPLLQPLSEGKELALIAIKSEIVILPIFSVVEAITAMSLFIRRLHENKKTGWFLLLNLTIIGIPVVLYYLYFKKGNNSDELN